MQDYFFVLFLKEQDESIKEQIYKQIFRKFTKEIANQNIYDLCLELDKKCFLKYFIFPLFDEFEKITSVDDIYLNIYNIAKANHVVYSFIKETKNNKYRFFSSEIREGDWASIYSYFGIDLSTVLHPSDGNALNFIKKEKFNVLLQLGILKPETRSNAFPNAYTIDISETTFENAIKIFELLLDFEGFKNIIASCRNLHVTLVEELKNDMKNNLTLLDYASLVSEKK